MLPASSRAQEANAIDPMQFDNAVQERRFQDLAGQLRCLVCQDESLLASNADLARQMRHIVYNKMQAGWSDEQIKQYLVDRYSEYVLYKPRLHPGTWLLWFGPPLILLAGGAAVFATVRKRKAHAPLVVPDADDDDW